MPELPPKRSGDIASFDRLSRLIGDGSLRPHGDKPARKILSGRGKNVKVERIIPMDIHPQVIDVPKRSVSSAYAG